MISKLPTAREGMTLRYDTHELSAVCSGTYGLILADWPKYSKELWCEGRVAYGTRHLPTSLSGTLQIYEIVAISER